MALDPFLASILSRLGDGNGGGGSAAPSDGHAAPGSVRPAVSGSGSSGAAEMALEPWVIPFQALQLRRLIGRG